ncbi:MAG: hypothetical protein JWN65_4158 [Solirubrobacterales bacterium]|nr:hypothetical protein [Solirubrobacterales bacterium]
MDLHRVTDDLKDVAQRLETHARPVRVRMDALGAAGLYALAAGEQRVADQAGDEDRRRVHAAAANAAQSLADRMVAAGPRTT